MTGLLLMGVPNVSATGNAKTGSRGNSKRLRTQRIGNRHHIPNEEKCELLMPIFTFRSNPSWRYKIEVRSN
jgi:hypothetical protein